MKGFFRFGNPVINFVLDKTKVALLLDTGFNGELMLTQKIINKLKLEHIGFSDYTDASGKQNFTKVYKTTFNFFDMKKEVIVLSSNANFSLAGMELFHDCKIIIERSKNIVEVSKNWRWLAS